MAALAFGVIWGGVVLIYYGTQRFKGCDVTILDVALPGRGYTPCEPQAPGPQPTPKTTPGEQNKGGKKTPIGPGGVFRG